MCEQVPRFVCWRWAWFVLEYSELINSNHKLAIFDSSKPVIYESYGY